MIMMGGGVDLDFPTFLAIAQHGIIAGSVRKRVATAYLNYAPIQPSNYTSYVDFAYLLFHVQGPAFLVLH